MLCRFTAFVAVDSRVVDEGGKTRRVTQPVELPSGWAAPEHTTTDMIKLSAVAPAPPLQASAAPPSFAPASAAADRPGAMSLSFAAMPQAMRSGRAAAGAAAGGAPSLDDLRTIAATEAGRLREAGTLPAHERRDLLDDLASRLAVLVGALTEKEFAPLRDLITVLTGDEPVEEKWSVALKVLTAFGGKAARGAGGGSGAAASATEARPPQHDRKAFWKR